ncbi:phosphatidylinositol mannoside acyltransferase [Aquipuribacter hungaricus]|uniref:Phosphatidylinositol mannoside acyltransferase n=1 Tax=Aquipuribacter hungaricus TaxID=545624 RepID=A0ABV7WE18_9MICO
MTPGSVPARLRDGLVAAAYGAAWRGVRWLPERTAYALGDRVADRVTRRGGRGVRRLRDNLARAVPGAGPDELRRLTGEAVRSYLRYWVDAFRLPDWDTARVVGPVRTVGDGPVREALASGRGVVGALAHLGNWDHAGAWSRERLAPVTTVAERLRPESVFLRFLAFRESLGIEILAHPAGGAPADGPGVTAVLEQRLWDGVFVPLLADRDLSGRGVVVDLLGEPARVAGGPAVLAGRTGALLLAIGITYERTAASASGWGTVITFHPPVDVPDGSPAAVQAASQRLADDLSTSIRASPADWHMLQAVFVADVGREPAPW